MKMTNFAEDKISLYARSTAKLCKEACTSNNVFYLKPPLLMTEKLYKIGETIQQRNTGTEKQFFFITLNHYVVTELVDICKPM